MIDQFVDDAKKEIGKKISDQFHLSDSEMETMFRITKNALQDQVKSYFFKGKIDAIVGLFTKDETHPPIVEETISKIKTSLQNQMSFSDVKSHEISNTTVPAIVSFFKARFKESGKSADMKGISEFLGMGGMANIFSIFGKFK